MLSSGGISLLQIFLFKFFLASVHLEINFNRAGFFFYFLRTETSLKALASDIQKIKNKKNDVLTY